jgi:hypothetical protein
MPKRDWRLERIDEKDRWGGSRDGNWYKPAGFYRPKPVPVKNIYVH